MPAGCSCPAARDNGVKLMEAFMYRFHPRTERVIELVRGGSSGGEDIRWTNLD